MKQMVASTVRSVQGCVTAPRINSDTADRAAPAGNLLSGETVWEKFCVAQHAFADLCTVPKHFMSISLCRRQFKMAALFLFFFFFFCRSSCLGAHRQQCNVKTIWMPNSLKSRLTIIIIT